MTDLHRHYWQDMTPQGLTADHPIGDAFTLIGNAAMLLVGTWDQVFGASSLVATALIAVAGNMERLAAAHRLARRTAAVIRQNLAFALGAMLVLVIGSTFFELPLPLAVIGHEGRTLLVVLNGLRLLFDPIRADGRA